MFVGLWGATIGSFLLVLIGLGIFVYFIREGLETEHEEGLQEVDRLLNEMEKRKQHPK
ncbi:MAG TPA: hypothetical protein VNM69_19690 [Bacillus sp. (in: firmicutes)]|uniref:hypothetical protein n=1 Tax=Bacillus litorisediminis TaxID=2922713 RepID=UPI001FAC4539|nr:hypothetical protein [Bacillus litorisediminis]HWO78095.1 hypothetical protein [Bacillus sp. (in: firmicutes)]